MDLSQRKYPYKKPAGHVPPIPRWQIEFKSPWTALHVVYLGIQCHDAAGRAACDALAAAMPQALTAGANRPYAFDPFEILMGGDIPASRIWVAYWIDEARCTAWMEGNAPHALLAKAGAAATHVGVWSEYFSIRPGRLETNYSGLDYIPGLARHPEAYTVAHEHTAYWGAARDRIKDSGHDLFEDRFDPASVKVVPAGRGQRVTGTPFQNMVHIRSGQFWENCVPVERNAYETRLQPTLVNGMRYLWDNAVVTGTFGLRYVNTLDSSGRKLLETAGIGFYRSLGHLEHWAATHPSHLAIFHGAIAHANEFGTSRKMRTWHEVGVLNEGEGSFEYLNCHPNTGVMPFLPMTVEGL